MIVLCFNMQHLVRTTMGLQQFQPLIKAFTSPLRIIPNQGGGDIENRAEYYTQQILNIAKGQPINLVGYSLAGLDLRYALHNNKELQQLTKSLITIGTPHRGSYLADQYRGGGITKEFIEPLSRVLGVGTQYFEEVNTHNIREFNMVTPNKESVKYYSIDAETIVSNMKPIFQFPGNFIEQTRETPLISGSDGIFVHGEGRWGTHLATMDCDHGALVGTPEPINAERVADIIEQAIQLQ